MGREDNTLKINNQYPDLLSSVIQLHSFNVPLYQRDYTWTNENWDELFNDIEQENSIFLGTIFLYKKRTDQTVQESEIIDGQQRITTYSLLINALRLIYLGLKKTPTNQKTISELNKYLFKENQIPKLSLYSDPEGIVNTSRTYKEVLKYEYMPQTLKKINSELLVIKKLKVSIMDQLKKLRNEIKTITDKNKLNTLIKKKQTLNTEKKTINEQIKKLSEKKKKLKSELENKSESEINILECNEFFFDRLKNLEEKKIKKILKKIKENIKVFLLLTSNTNSVYDYFRTLNSSGVELTISEILKNDLFKNVLKSDIKKVISGFEEIKKSIKNVKNEDMESFLLYSLNSRNDAKFIAESIKKSYPLTKKNMLHAYGEILKKDGTNNAAKNLIVSLKENIKEYLEIISPTSIHNHMKEEKFYYYNVLEAFNISKPISAFLTSKRNFIKADHLKNVRLLTYICLKQSIKPYGDPKDLQGYMNTAYEEFLKKSSYDDIKKILSEKTEDFFADEFLEKELVLVKKPLNNNKSKAFIALLQRKAWKSLSGTIQNYDLLSLEHIMPENQSKYWKNPSFYKAEPKAQDDMKLYKGWVGQLGNHCIITLVDNKELKDKGFKAKLAKYKTYDKSVMDGIVDKKSWTLTMIQNRNKDIYSKFIALGK